MVVSGCEPRSATPGRGIVTALIALMLLSSFLIAVARAVHERADHREHQSRARQAADAGGVWRRAVDLGAGERHLDTGAAP